jgi:HlyD family secretion protein
MKRRTLVFLIILAAIIASAIIYSVASKDDLAKPLEAEVKLGEFEVVITVTGELQAQTSTDINAPLLLRSRELRLHRIQIQDLIPEGTVVDSGDYVATLDRSEADNSYKDISDELEVRESDYTKTKLDTTIQLRELRDEMINLKFNMEEAQITLEQSQFEPPTTIRQAKINLDKAERAYEQAVKNYQLKVQQAKADMTEVTVDLAKQRRRKAQMEDVLQRFVIHAPAPGMVIYKREWSGQKRTVGSEISPWDLTVATLPDMSTMVSKTYVNEIDISKIKVGQEVRAGVDAFPEKQYTGQVTEVANIGEQLPNTDAKVFEVVIKLNESDPILRPSMTTSNSIVTKLFDSVLYIPLEAVHSNDSMTYVYLKNNTKQVVVLDESNENEIIVDAGLKAGDKVLLSVPEGAEDMRFTGLELVEVIRQKEAEKKRVEEELQKQREEQQEQRNLRRRMPAQTGAQAAGDRPTGTG